MLLSYKYRLYPTKEQIWILDRQLDGHRFLYNKALENRKTSYEILGKGVSYKEQVTTLLPAFKKVNPNIGICNYSSLQQTLRRIDKSFQSFFRRVKAKETPGYPRFKSVDRFNSIHYAKMGDGCQIKDNHLYIQNVGEIKIKLHREMPCDPKTALIKKINKKWYVCFMVESEPTLLAKTRKKIGIDVGVSNFIFGSNGLKVESPKYLRASEKKLTKAQKKLSRRKKGGARRSKARQLVALIHEKISNQRLNFFHKVALYLVKNFDKIAIEDLSINNMVKNHHLAKSINDSAWSTFFNILIYKAENAGKEVVKVDPRNTSQVCCKCNRIVKKDLSVRVHKCICGIEIDRDLNAAINILKRAWAVPSVLALLRECHREAVCFS